MFRSRVSARIPGGRGQPADSLPSGLSCGVEWKEPGLVWAPVNPVATRRDTGTPRPGQAESQPRLKTCRARCNCKGDGGCPSLEPGAFQGWRRIRRLPAGGERKCIVCSRRAGDVDFQGVGTGDNSAVTQARLWKRPCSPLHSRGGGSPRQNSAEGTVELPARTTPSDTQIPFPQYGRPA